MNANLILADDNSATRSALAFILGHRLGLNVAGEAASTAELAWLLGAGSLQAATLILDWDLPGLCPTEGIAALRKLKPNLRIVVLSTRLEVRNQALAAGADAFISMSEPPEMLLATIYTVTSGAQHQG
jgi:DNA-binding NarL/FixJ family response regulator